MLWEGNADVSSAGVEEVLHSYGQGDYFGELALLSTKGALHSPETRSQHVSLRMLGASVLSWSFGGGAQGCAAPRSLQPAGTPPTRRQHIASGFQKPTSTGWCRSAQQRCKHTAVALCVSTAVRDQGSACPRGGPQVAAGMPAPPTTTQIVAALAGVPFFADFPAAQIESTAVSAHPEHTPSQVTPAHAKHLG